MKSTSSKRNVLAKQVSAFYTSDMKSLSDIASDTDATGEARPGEDTEEEKRTEREEEKQRNSRKSRGHKRLRRGGAEHEGEGGDTTGPGGEEETREADREGSEGRGKSVELSSSW